MVYHDENCLEMIPIIFLHILELKKRKNKKYIFNFLLLVRKNKLKFFIEGVKIRSPEFLNKLTINAAENKLFLQLKKLYLADM